MRMHRCRLKVCVIAPPFAWLLCATASETLSHPQEFELTSDRDLSERLPLDCTCKGKWWSTQQAICGL